MTRTANFIVLVATTVLVAALLIVRSETLELQPSVSQMRLYVIDGGQTRLPKVMFSPGIYPEAEQITLPVRSFLIVHPKGTLIWDTGHADDLASASVVPNSLYQIEVKRGVEKQLQDIGFPPQSIDRIAFSHWHFDHTGNANLFRNAVVTGQRDEYMLAFAPNAEKFFGMQPRTYLALKDNPTQLFHGDLDVFGDGRVVILRTSGHTIGSQMLYLELQDGPVLLSGDLWHFSEQRKFRRVPPFNVDVVATLESIERIEKFLYEHPEVRLWITHDPEQMSEVRLSPGYYK